MILRARSSGLPGRLLLLVAGGAVLAGCAAPTQGVVALPGAGRTVVQAPVKSLVELRFRNVVRQANDLSCGAAALATILTHFYGDTVPERKVIEEALQLGDRDKILRDGFSMLELKRFAERQGYVAAGYRLQRVEDLAKLRVPALTLVNIRGYAHFVVIKGVVEGQVLVADPAFGNRVRPLRAFDREWNKVILVVLSRDRAGDTAFFEDGALRARVGETTRLLDPVLHTIVPRPGEFHLK